jgi:hypothetical protein
VTDREYIRRELKRSRARLEVAEKFLLARSTDSEKVSEQAQYCRSIAREVAHWERRLAATNPANNHSK